MSASFSASVAVAVKLTASPTRTLGLVIALTVGAVFGATVIVTVRGALARLPSDAVTETEKVPAVAEAQLNTPAELNVAPVGTPVAVKVSGSISGSPPVAVKVTV